MSKNGAGYDPSIEDVPNNLYEVDSSEIYTVKKPMNKITNILFALVVILFIAMVVSQVTKQKVNTPTPPYSKEKMCHDVGLDYDMYENKCFVSDDGVFLEPNVDYKG